MPAGRALRRAGADPEKALARDIDRALPTRVRLRGRPARVAEGARRDRPPRTCSPTLVDLEAPTHAPLADDRGAGGDGVAPGAATSIDAGATAIAPPRCDGGATVEMGARPGSGSLRRGSQPAGRAGARPDTGPPVRTGASRPAAARPAARVQPASSAERTAVGGDGTRAARRRGRGRARLEDAAGAGRAAGFRWPWRRRRRSPRRPRPSPQRPRHRLPRPSRLSPRRRARPPPRSAPPSPPSAPAATTARSPRRRTRCARTPRTPARRRCSTTPSPARRRRVELRAGEAALARGDFAGADGAGRRRRGSSAPWDAAAASLATRVAEARSRAERDVQAKAQQARSGQLNALLNEAASAMEKKQFEAALAAYDRALAIDPGNAVAQNGKSNAVTARTVAEAAAGAGRPAAVARSFVAGKTEAKGAEGDGRPRRVRGHRRRRRSRRATQAAELPGRIVFERERRPRRRPASATASRCCLAQRGRAADPARVDDRRDDGRRPPRRPARCRRSATTVAPGARAVVFQTRAIECGGTARARGRWRSCCRRRRARATRNTLSWK